MGNEGESKISLKMMHNKELTLSFDIHQKYISFDGFLAFFFLNAIFWPKEALNQKNQESGPSLKLNFVYWVVFSSLSEPF